MLICVWCIVIVHFVFRISDNSFFCLNIRSQLRRFRGYHDILIKYLCALFLQRGKAIIVTGYVDFWYIAAVYIVFSLSKNPISLKCYVYTGCLIKVMCILLQRDKAMDLKSCVALLLIYCSCALCILFIRKFFFFVWIWGQDFGI